MDIVYTPGLIAVSGKISDNTLHKHHALQLTIATDTPFKLSLEDQNIHDVCVLIPQNTPHKLNSSQCLILLIEPESHLAEIFVDMWLKDAAVFSFPKAVYQLIRKKIIGKSLSLELINTLLEIFTTTPCLKRHLEERIQKLVHWIDACETDHNLHSVSLDKALDVVHLSESRFLHLFSEQLGIPWRRYLLWRRLLSAIVSAVNGKTLTESAHEAGFSDSAHFSRSFRNMFGFPPGSIIKNSRFIQVSGSD